MNFEIFLSEYKFRIYKHIIPNKSTYKEIPKYRKEIFLFYFIFLIIGLGIISFFQYSFFLKYCFFIISISFIPYILIMSYFTLKGKNRIEWNKFRKNSFDKRILVLFKLLEEFEIDNRERRDYVINTAKKYKEKYSLKELLRIPTIFYITLTLFFIPRLQKIFDEIPNTLYLILFLIFILSSSIIYILYNMIKIFYISNYEICEILINDLEYISPFKEDFFKKK